MVYIPALATALLAALHAKRTAAHPGEHHDHEQVKRELAERSAYGAHIARSLEKCARSPKAEELAARAMKRREAKTQQLRARAGFDHQKMRKRDEAALESWGNVNHNETGEYTSPYSSSTLFGSNTSCVLTPEDVVGPYYVLGELIRSDVVESQSGVPVHLDLQFIDVSTCEPVSDSMMIDIWHANATGVYSGVASEAGLDTDFLRGVQQTDDDGVVEFDTIFPGHYQGRATHIHITSHVNSTTLSNNTYSGGTVTHIGQLFFEESLRSAVESVEPYASNTQAITSNNDDSLAPQQASAEYDPYPKYLYVGNSISDGLMMWISVGVDMSADYTSDASAAAVWGENGGYSTGNQGGSGGAPGGSGSGGAPSGASGFPSGAMPSGSGAPSGGAGGPSGSAGATMTGAPSGGVSMSGASASGASAATGTSRASGSGSVAGAGVGVGSVSGGTATGTASIPLFSSAAGASSVQTTSKGNVGSSSSYSSSFHSSQASQASTGPSFSSTRAATAAGVSTSSAASSPRQSTAAVATRATTAAGAPANSQNSVANSGPGGGSAGRGSTAAGGNGAAGGQPGAGGSGSTVRQSATASTRAAAPATSASRSGSGRPATGACTRRSGGPSGLPSGAPQQSSGFQTLPSGAKMPSMSRGTNGLPNGGSMRPSGSGMPSGAPGMMNGGEDDCGGEQGLPTSSPSGPGGNVNGGTSTQRVISSIRPQTTAKTTARTTTMTQSRRWLWAN